MPPRSHAGLRVHGGEAAGRRLLTPRAIRPTQGVVKEAIFNVLGAAVVDAVVLDLFSGSGALGIEALSRGARSVTFVERESSSVSILRRNLELLSYEPRARVVRTDAVKWLEAHVPDVAQAGLVLMDPPYRDAATAAALQVLDRHTAAGCTVVVEHARNDRLPALERLRPTREKAYGDSFVTVLRTASA